MIRGTLTWFCLIAVFGAVLSHTPTFARADRQTGAAPIEACADGAFGFDQSRATVLYHAPELRLSALVDGTLVWQGHPSVPQFEEAIKTALAAPAEAGRD